VRVLSPDTAYDNVRKAFYLAKMQSRPIMLSAPMDTQQKTMDDDEAYMPSSAVIPSALAYPNPSTIDQALDMIANAKRPVVLVGRGAVWSGAGDAAVKLAQRIGAVLATTLQA